MRHTLIYYDNTSLFHTTHSTNVISHSNDCSIQFTCKCSIQFDNNIYTILFIIITDWYLIHYINKYAKTFSFQVTIKLP